MRSECKEAFLKESARLEYCTYWDVKNDRPEAVLLQCHWSWFQVAWQHRQTEVDELQKRVDIAERKLQLVQECIAENAYSNMRSGGLVIQVAELEQALKEESNDH